MPNKQPIVLAINPGSRYFGFTAFRGPELLDWGVKVNRGTTPRGKVRVSAAIFVELVERFHPDKLAIKRLHPSRSSSSLDGLIDTVLELARQRKLSVCRHTIGQLKAALYEDAKGNKRRLAEEVTALYPLLGYDLQKETASRNPYRLRMFEAAALGIVCYRHFEE